MFKICEIVAENSLKEPSYDCIILVSENAENVKKAKEPISSLYSYLEPYVEAGKQIIP